jgi:plastocyanin
MLVASTPSALATSEPVSISIVDEPRPQLEWGYAPETRTIAPGTWVTWSNDGQDAHTVTAADGSFDSGNLDPSEGFSWYFDQPGTFGYVCTLHPWMSGTIVVADAAQPPADSEASDDP